MTDPSQKNENAPVPGDKSLDTESAEAGDHGHSCADASPEVQTGFVVSLLRLMRIPNVFTAIADILMGFAFVHQSFQPAGGLVLLVLATVCLYSAGMVWNDIFDLDKDQKERPERPLPSGAISLRTAWLWGSGLLAVGFLLASLSFPLFGNVQQPLWFGFEPSLIAIALIAAILLYNKTLKQTMFAPLAMGSCRTLNILLGMSLVSSEQSGIIPAGALLAASVGVFIAGVTWFARSEAKESDRGLLSFGFAVMVVGLAGIMATPFWGFELPQTVNPNKPYLLPFMIGLIGVSIGRLAMAAIADPVPANVQVAIKQCILSLILINAAICLWIDSRPESIYMAFSVVVLIFPAILLGRWFKST